MDDFLPLLLARNDGVVSGRELTECGLDGHTVRTLLRRGDLVRVRSGAFVGRDAWSVADAAGRHVLSARAITRRLEGYAVSHVTGVAMWGLPVLAEDLGPVDVCHIGHGQSRSAGRLRVHPAVPADAVVRRRGVSVVRAEVAVLQTAQQSLRAGLVAADGALRQGLPRERLVAETSRRRYGARASLVLALASALSESPGESWTRLVLTGLGIEAEQQAEIRGPDGRFVARVDFLVRGESLVIEFDGAMKYDGLEGRRALVTEKRREDELRSLGYRVVRLTWADLADPGRVLALLRRGVLQRTSRPSAYGSAS
ncbi:MAG: type IV toxin-antitoxin system AbiEi family antitoxin domain-containing protein [Lapillicoccus sp.]